MKNCPYCSAKIAENANFCIFCMQNLAEKTIIKPKKIFSKPVKRLSACLLALLITLSSAFLLYRPNGELPNPPVNEEAVQGSDTIETTPTDKEQKEEQSGGLGGFIENLFDNNKNEDDEAPDNETNTGTNTNTDTNTNEYEGKVLELTYSTNSLNTECVVTGIAEGATGDTVKIPETYNGAKVVAIGDMAFFLTENIKEVYIPGNVKKIGNKAFLGCGVSKLTLCEGIETVEGGAFSDCYSLTEVTLPSTLTSGGFMFNNCTNLKTVNSKCVWTKEFDFAFQNCTALESITVPEGTTEITLGVFWGCTNLKTVILPSSLASISSDAFQYCSSLTDIYFMGTIAEWNARDFVKNNALSASGTSSYTLHCTDGVIKKQVNN